MSLQPAEARTQEFYRAVLGTLAEADVPYLVGGTYAVERYTRVSRPTKDLDLFVHPRDCDRALGVLSERGHRADMVFSHWLGKVRSGDDVIDLIFSSGNGVAEVDDAWFEHAERGEVLDVPVLICPPEEVLWSKAFIMERERYDGADVAHLLFVTADRLDWDRVLARFGDDWRVLLSHLVLFGYIYPCERGRVPPRVMRELLRRLGDEVRSEPAGDRLCRGTLLSRAQYLVDVEEWGFRDARLPPTGTMTGREVARWTQAIDQSPSVDASRGGR
jgi:hypothetical protein